MRPIRWDEGTFTLRVTPASRQSVQGCDLPPLFATPMMVMAWRMPRQRHPRLSEPGERGRTMVISATAGRRRPCRDGATEVTAVDGRRIASSWRARRDRGDRQTHPRADGGRGRPARQTIGGQETRRKQLIRSAAFRRSTQPSPPATVGAWARGSCRSSATTARHARQRLHDITGGRPADRRPHRASVGMPVPSMTMASSGLSVERAQRPHRARSGRGCRSDEGAFGIEDTSALSTSALKTLAALKHLPPRSRRGVISPIPTLASLRSWDRAKPDDAARVQGPSASRPHRCVITTAPRAELGVPRSPPVGPGR